MLAFYSHALIVTVTASAFSNRTSCKPVSGIYLHAWLCGYHFQSPSAGRGIQFSSCLQLTGLSTVDHPAVVIPFPIFQSREIFPDITSERLGYSEIHRSARHRHTLSLRYQSVISREIFRSIQPQLMRKDASAAFPVQVEIGVVGEVYNSRGIRLCRKSEPEFILFRPFISCHCFQISRISHFTILGEVHELHPVSFYTAFPYLVLESFRTAMKMVRTVIHRKSIFLAVQREMSQGYPVCIPSRNFPGAWPVAEITCRISVSQYHVGQLAIPVRNIDRDYAGTYT